MDKILEYLNENPGVEVIIAAIAVLVTVLGWFIKKKQKSIYKNSPHITAGGHISSGGNIVVGNSNVVEATSIPEFHLHLYGAGSKRKIEGHVEKKDSRTLIVESVEIDDFENRKFELTKKPDSSIQKDALLPLRPIWLRGLDSNQQPHP